MQEITMIKNTFFNFKVKIDIKTTTTTVIKNELKYSPMSEGNTCNAKPNLGVITLYPIQYGGPKRSPTSFPHMTTSTLQFESHDKV